MYNIPTVETVCFFSFFFPSELVLGLIWFEFYFYFEVTCLFCESLYLLLGFATAEIVTFSHLSWVLHISFPDLELNGTKVVLKFNGFLGHGFAGESSSFTHERWCGILFRKNSMNGKRGKWIIMFNLKCVWCISFSFKWTTQKCVCR